ncbi:MAG: hypothetical protein RR739_06765 [Clostridia bacterium]
MLLMDRRRALGGWLLISVLAGLLLYVQSVSYLLLDEAGDPLMLFELSASISFVSLVMPAIAALPFGTGFCADWQATYAGTAALRAGKRRYLLSKVFCCALSGGLAAMGAMLAFVVLINLRYPQGFSLEPTFMELVYLKSLLIGGGMARYLVYYLSHLLLAFLSGGFWATTAMCFSAFYPNVPMTLVAPLLLHRLLSEVSLMLELPPWLNVTALSDGAAGLAPLPLLGAALLLYLTATLLVGALFFRRAKRRLNNAS